METTTSAENTSEGTNNQTGEDTKTVTDTTESETPKQTSEETETTEKSQSQSETKENVKTVVKQKPSDYDPIDDKIVVRDAPSDVKTESNTAAATADTDTADKKDTADTEETITETLEEVSKKFEDFLNACHDKVKFSPVRLGHLKKEDFMCLFRKCKTVEIQLENKEGYMILEFKPFKPWVAVDIFVAIERLLKNEKDIKLECSEKFSEMFELAKVKKLSDPLKSSLLPSCVYASIFRIEDSILEEKLKELFPDYIKSCVPRDTDGEKFGWAILQYSSKQAASDTVEKLGVLKCDDKQVMYGQMTIDGIKVPRGWQQRNRGQRRGNKKTTLNGNQAKATGNQGKDLKRKAPSGSQGNQQRKRRFNSGGDRRQSYGYSRSSFSMGSMGMPMDMPMMSDMNSSFMNRQGMNFMDSAQMNPMNRRGMGFMDVNMGNMRGMGYMDEPQSFDMGMSRRDMGYGMGSSFQRSPMMSQAEDRFRGDFDEPGSGMQGGGRRRRNRRFKRRQ